MREEQVKFFENRHYMLSNFSAHAVQVDGVLYMTAEHAYQASKFQDQRVWSAVTAARSARMAKTISHANSAHKRSDWDKVKMLVMEKILRAKVAQHADVQEALLASGTRVILENSPLDAFWGTGTDGKGRSELGKLWMRIREDLQNNPNGV